MPRSSLSVTIAAGDGAIFARVDSGLTDDVLVFLDRALGCVLESAADHRRGRMTAPSDRMATRATLHQGNMCG
jgi:hypothetical protein